MGSKNSSNSNRLREVAKHRGIKAHLIDQADEIDPQWLNDVKKIGLTAGASAPEILVKDVVTRLQAHGAEVIREIEGEEENVVFAVNSDR